MSVLEIATCEHGIHIAVEDREYLILAGWQSGSVTVIAGRRWINSRRALGKTFWKDEDLLSHYKRDGAVVLEYARKCGFAA